MLRLRRIRLAFDNFFLRHYHLIIVTSIIAAAIVGFFHFELKFHDKDLIFWTGTFHNLYKEYEYLFLVTTAIIVAIKIAITLFVFAINMGPLEWFEDVTRLEVQKRYADFLFIRLVTEISNIKEKELRNKQIISISSFIRAHEEIQSKIAKFRKDARKLLTPNEIEITLPPEEIFDTDEDPIDKKYAHITVEKEILKKLVNP